MKRVIILMDVTDVEARLLGEHLKELGPEYKGLGVAEGVERVLAANTDGERLFVSIRSGASAALGGPAMPDLAPRS